MSATDQPEPDVILPKMRPMRPMRRFAMARTVFALILREMSTRYGRSPGGYIWALLDPIGAIAIMTFAFSLVIQAPALGSSFVLFYTTGYIPFQVYQNISVTVSRSISFSKPLLFYPSVSWLDAVLARFILNALTAIIVGYIIITFVLALEKTQTVLEIGPILMAMGLAALTGLGVGVLNCAFSGFSPTWEIVWSIATRPLFLISGVMFSYETMPPIVQNILWYNPLLHISGIMREGFYPMYETQCGSPLYVLIIALVTLTIGLALLRKHASTFIND